MESKLEVIEQISESHQSDQEPGQASEQLSMEPKTNETQKVKEEKNNSFTMSECYDTEEPSFLQLSDFVIVGVDGFEHKVHRVVLSSHSLHFRETIFSHPHSKEFQDATYKFSEEIDPTNVLKKVIDYMYTEKIELSPTTSVAVYKIADFLQMPKLLKRVQDYIFDTKLVNFTIDELLFLSDQEFLITWLESNQLLVDNEEKVYEVIEEMVNQIPPERISVEPELPQKLIECVRFCQLSYDCLRKANSNPHVPRQSLVDHLFNMHYKENGKEHTDEDISSDENISDKNRFTARDSYCSSPMIIEGVRICFLNVKSSRDDIDMKISLKEYKYSELDGFHSRGMSTLYNESVSLQRSDHWKYLKFSNSFKWNIKYNLLFEFYSQNCLSTGNENMAFLTSERHNSTIVWKLDSGGMGFRSPIDELKMKEKKCQNNLPHINLLGKIRNKPVTLILKIGKDKAKSDTTPIQYYSQGVMFSTMQGRRYIQAIYRFSDFELVSGP